MVNKNRERKDSQLQLPAIEIALQLQLEPDSPLYRPPTAKKRLIFQEAAK
jgi:hypothetical protein